MMNKYAPRPQSASKPAAPASGGAFYEIEYNSGPVPGVGKFVPKPQKIAAPEKDEIRELFVRMRNIAREYQPSYDFFRFFDRRVHSDNARIFYQQGLMMRDFADDFDESAEVSTYFPSYQTLGYKQLRTYFTWRARVRRGNVAATSPAYAFLYIYELLGNIGVADPQEGLERLYAFWQAFRAYDIVVDRYVLRWLKDYHVYYQLPHSWAEFVERSSLERYYPETSETEDSFAVFCALSKYKIKQSPFYTDATKELIAACIPFVMDRIKRDLEAAGIDSGDALLRPARSLAVWQPFKDAIFHDWLQQPDRRVVLAGNEVYERKDDTWFFNTVVVSEKGKRFVGYVMKQTEAVLRKIAKYKYKINAKLSMIDEDTLDTLKGAGLSIERIVTAAVTEFYREATKTVVAVDQSSLSRIRQEALATQEALLVAEQTLPPGAAQTLAAGTGNEGAATPEDKGLKLTPPPIIAGGERDKPAITGGSADSNDEIGPVLDLWAKLKELLNEGELQALALLWQGGDLNALANAQGVMPEVLVDGINQKAMDCIGDNLMDEDFVLYDEYLEQVKELIP